MKTVAAIILWIALIAHGSSQDCELGSWLNPTSPSNEIGHFLDLDQPAPCSGTLTAWRICFYSNALAPGTKVHMVIRIWRSNGEDLFTRVSGNNVNFTISSSTTPLTCGVIQNVQVQIRQGDVYGVLLRSDATHPPVLAQLPPNMGRRLYRDSRSPNRVIDGTLLWQSSDLETVRNIGLHIYANISIDRTITPIPTTTTTTDSIPTTTSTSAIPTTDSIPTTTSTNAIPTTDSIPTSTSTDAIIPTTDSIPTTTSTDAKPTPSNPTFEPTMEAVLKLSNLGTENGSETEMTNESATTDMPSLNRLNNGVMAAVVIVILVVLVGSAVGGVMICIIVRCRKDSSKRKVGLDNALYRIGSQYMLSKSPSPRKRSNTYEYPVIDDSKLIPGPVTKWQKATSANAKEMKDAIDINIYSIHTSFAVETGSNNSSILTNLAEIGCSTYSVPTSISIRQSNDYDIEIGCSTYSVPTSISIRQSNDYDIPTSIPLNDNACANHVLETQMMIESPVESEVTEVASGDKKLDGPDYIYMDDNVHNVPSQAHEAALSCGLDENDVLPVEEECIGPEDTQMYDFVQYHTLLQQAAANKIYDESPYHPPPSREDEIYDLISEQQIKVIPRHAITATRVIGSGEFGQVNKGLWKSTKQRATLEVALKTIPKEEGKANHRLKLLQEALIMAQFSHPNIVQLYGIVLYGDPQVLVMEYMANRDLKRYLLRFKSKQGEGIDGNTPHLLLAFSEQVVLGMHYLASKRLVHRDLAARNIFVSKDNICKIGDFGMAKDISESGFYFGNDGKVPLKWTAPEAISLKKYSTASDVWSYGCLLYEIWSLGAKPFKGLKNDEAIAKIDSGFRLPPPPGCPQAIYMLMMQCWHPASTARPKCQAILTSLLEDPKKVLLIPQCAASSHALACILGSPLEAGLEMYPDIQCTYMPDSNGLNFCSLSPTHRR